MKTILQVMQSKSEAMKWEQFLKYLEILSYRTLFLSHPVHVAVQKAMKIPSAVKNTAGPGLL